ncbi:hypothetical protein [Bacillus benzoevorans]|uniref:Uncharacterized protein n=1 Tax=Bacillus benzoevorans TaxID=1456 RepID=A0A7X0LT60_9BACI|nr:hypothetical protein [Bacillus benzoevorans]MBB6443576.1 hypothetical protein [Bacillus benzoevorans]
MEKEKVSAQKTKEVNLKLNQELNDADNIPFAFGGGEINSATGANINIQEALEGDHGLGENIGDSVLPTYMTNNAPAIKITGNNK